ncbi:hypothetical protein [Thioalkalivibrio sp.]|uniref:hypothetical protein n=1 Tax=Thioalkalivibrio sp. TaxID=2093813 RepID=UPI0012D6D354|nr:hypothetical protein [Thioalkalivibrio sp.]TVP82895.1 MAG: hypothetical protein EA346_01765 [Thioalkalivibrio sp.]
MIWVAAILVLILVLDFARQPVRRFLVATASLIARITCGLRAQLVHLRDAVGRWQSLHLARLEAVRLADAVDALERNYGDLIGHDLALLPDLRQHTYAVLRDLESAYAREETGLTSEPAWVRRLESLARTPSGDQPQSQRLARDMQETVLRIARMALEEHRQNARALLATRRRLQQPLQDLVSRLASLQERLASLEGQAQGLDAKLKRFEQNRTNRSLRMPVYARAGGQWLLSAAGLALAALAVYVYQQVFHEPFELLFPALTDTTPDVSMLAIWTLLGVSALTGWILVETRAAAGAGLTPLARLAPFSRALLTAIAGAILLAVVIVSMINGYLREWFLYRAELVEVLMAGGVQPPGPDVDWVAQILGGLLGLVLPLVVALAPLWLLGLLAATRVLSGGALWVLLALLAGLLQWLAGISMQLRRWLPAGFDLVIFLPEAFRRWRRRDPA